MERNNEARWIEARQRWQINVQRDGVRRTFTSTIKGKRGKADAERKADKWLEDATTAETVRVEKLLDQWVEYLKETKSKTHHRQYAGFVRNHIKPVIGAKKLAKLTEGDLQDIIDKAYARKKLSHKTLKDIRDCIMNFVKWCRIHGRTRLHPEGLTLPAGAKRPDKQILQPEAITILFRSAKTTWRGKERDDWYIHAYRFAVLTGVRPGELRGLQMADIRDNKVSIRRSINIDKETTQGKNFNARRTFALGPLAMAELAAQKKMLADASVTSLYIFPAPNGEPLMYKNFYRAWHRYCEANGIPETSLYEMMRHTYVSVNKEMPAGLKKGTIGHSENMDTEGVYGHEMAGDLERAAAYSDNAFREILS